MSGFLLNVRNDLETIKPYTVKNLEGKRLNSMYEWVVFLHVIGVFGFAMAHGASVFVAFRLQQEQEVGRLRALLDLSRLSLRGMSGSTILLLIAGIVAGFMGRWWGQAWIWISIGILVVITVVMILISGRAYYPLRTALGMPGPWDKVEGPPGEPVSDEEIRTFIVAGHPRLMTIIGVGGFLIVLGLMRFKPF